MDVTERAATALLIEAREFISDPGRWCQGDGAIDEFGDPVPSDCVLDAAKCRGVVALERAWFAARDLDPHAQFGPAGDLLEQAAILLYPESADRFLLGPAAYVNDHLGHAAILRVYDAATPRVRELINEH